MHVLRKKQHFKCRPEAQQLQLAVQLALLTRDAVHDVADVVEHAFELRLEGRGFGREAVSDFLANGFEKQTLVERAEHALAGG